MMVKKQARLGPISAELTKVGEGVSNDKSITPK
jgi:hypothetical protein